MTNPEKNQEKEFLKESNAIEGVYDKKSLDQAKVAWKYLTQQTALNEQIILRTHKILMLHQNHLMPNEKGYFRKIPVSVGGQPVMAPQFIRNALKHWLFESLGTVPPIDPKELHVRFEKIHPFVDGNGRVGRMLMNWQYLKILKKPLVIIHAGTLEQTEYYDWFK